MYSATSELPHEKLNRSIFISYSRKDGRNFAHTIRQQLEAQGFKVWQDVVSEVPSQGWWQNIVHAIENSDAMILVFTEGALQSAVVKEEWLYARKVGITILPIIAEQGLLNKLNDKNERIVPAWLDRLHLLILDEANSDYQWHLERLITVLRTPVPKQPVPFTAPPLSTHFVHRLDYERNISARLVGQDHLTPRGGYLALVGAAGFGKTTLAQMICYEPEIIEAYKDGIFWLTLGEDANDITVVDRLNEVVKLLGGSPTNSLTEAVRVYTNLLS